MYIKMTTHSQGPLRQMPTATLAVEVHTQRRYTVLLTYGRRCNSCSFTCCLVPLLTTALDRTLPSSSSFSLCSIATSLPTTVLSVSTLALWSIRRCLVVRLSHASLFSSRNEAGPELYGDEAGVRGQVTSRGGRKDVTYAAMLKTPCRSWWSVGHACESEPIGGYRPASLPDQLM